MGFMSALLIKCDTPYCMSQRNYTGHKYIAPTVFEIKESLKKLGWYLPENSIEKTYCEKCVKEGRVAIKNI